MDLFSTAHDMNAEIRRFHRTVSCRKYVQFAHRCAVTQPHTVGAACALSWLVGKAEEEEGGGGDERK